MSIDDSMEPHFDGSLSERESWWSPDFLKLIAARLQLERVSRVLDVGAGMGDWATTLLAVLASRASVVGLDEDPCRVALAERRVVAIGLAERCSFVRGVAEALPFGDESFDLVTCQTLLIHVKDPAAVIEEMRRVVRPGGLLLLSEPNNLAGMLVADSVIADRPVSELIERVEFARICDRGKALLGEGNNWVADLLPGLLADAGMIDVQCVMNEKTSPLVPPYTPDEQQDLRAAVLATPEGESWGWPAADTKRYFLVGGGDPDEFEQRWQRRVEEHRQIARELAANRLHTAGGAIHYLISGRRPSPARTGPGEGTTS